MKYFFNTGFRYVNWLSVIVATLIFVISIVVNIFASDSDHSNIFLFLNGVSGVGVLSLTVIFVIMLPSSLSIYNDLKDNNIRNVLVRMNLKKYYFTKVLAVGLFTAIFFALLLAVLLIIALLYKDMPKNIPNNFVVGAFKSFYPQHKILYSILFIMNGFVFSFVFSILGMVTTIFWQNKYSAALIGSLLYLFTEPIFGIFQLERLGFSSLFEYQSNFLTNAHEMYIEFLLILIVSISLGYIKLKKVVNND
ncbi:hypothetical protein [Apilactobacillus kunkeei]|uniref:ABC-2 family transporter protein n=1 Tax=Apilactobacillus kunkeei TaxID=148814 RepID=A0A1L8CFS0_9LACO|nr:hypothetical protein [Apilactobacillus kunkeei]GAT90032.1 hypothetical protein FF306_00123 [Apilactobacillus kunkeei]